MHALVNTVVERTSPEFGVATVLSLAETFHC